MAVFVLAMGAALLFGVGSVVQQRAASEAPPGLALNPRLLLWLLRQRLWLLGVGTAIVGNLLSGAALGLGSVALVQPLLVTRLLFALPLAAAWMRRRVPNRDWVGALFTALGLAGFLVAGRPQSGNVTDPPALRWLFVSAGIGLITLALVMVARRLGPAREAPMLGAGAGMLFGLQAGLTHTAVRHFADNGVVGLLTTWETYAVAFTALAGTLLVQSAYEMAPLTSSYPSLAAVEPLAGIGIGVGVLGSTLATDSFALVGGVIALAIMTGGIFLLATSPLVTGQLHLLELKAEEGELERLEDTLAHDLEQVARDLEQVGTCTGKKARRLERKLRTDLDRVCEEVERLATLQSELDCDRKEVAQDDSVPQEELERLWRLLEERQEEIKERRVVLEKRSQELRAQAASVRQDVGAAT